MSKSLEKIATTLEKIEDELDTMNRIQTEIFYQMADDSEGQWDPETLKALIHESFPRKLPNIAPYINAYREQVKEKYYAES